MSASAAVVAEVGPGTGPLRFSQVDVFTDMPMRGNPLAVVHAADALDGAQMQAFARWTNLSETAFLLRPTDAAADYRVRIFTPGGELPFAGHPTLGSCHAWLDAGGVPRSAGTVVQECGIGPVSIRRGAGRVAAGGGGRPGVVEDAAPAPGREASRLAFAAPPLSSEPVEPALLAAVLGALGLRPEAVVAARWLDNGPRWLGIELASAAEVLALTPDPSALKPLAKVALIGPHVPGGDADFEVRAFAPSIGVPEDPVTGSVNASLAQWLMGRGAAPDRYVAAQGACVGRAGRIHIERQGPTVWVGGDSIMLVRGTVEL